MKDECRYPSKTAIPSISPDQPDVDHLETQCFYVPPMSRNVKSTSDLLVHQTPQDPPYPMMTFSPSTITGTFRTPLEYFNISSNFALSALTSKYFAVLP